MRNHKNVLCNPCFPIKIYGFPPKYLQVLPLKPLKTAFVEEDDITLSNNSSYLNVTHLGPEDDDEQLSTAGDSRLKCRMPKCQLNQEPGYVIYSAVGSFYAPMLVMMFFNWRIFRTATKTTQAIRQGWTKVKGAEGADSGRKDVGKTVLRNRHT